MTVNIGVVGTGMIGTVHINNLTSGVSGSSVTAVMDTDAARAADIARRVGATAVGSSADLARRDDVDAVLIATPGYTHAEIVLDLLSVGKPVLCEKPLATRADDAVRILEAEAAMGKRLIQVGFMRRFDPGYLEVKAAIDDGSIGEPLMVHMFHRNPEVPDFFGDEMVMNDAFIHEMDVTRWLLGDEVVAVRVLQGKSTPAAGADLHDPQILVLETRSGVLVVAEAFVANGFGYDVRCEVLGSTGTIELATPRLSRRTSQGSVSEIIHPSWRERFGETYRLELQEWVRSIEAGRPAGPSSWDGYAATVIADACVAAVSTPGDRVPVGLTERPALYA
jgi:myo-inositol 2-dehydrogenase/D-chiro-inositol 1-dehydrogenase